MVYSPLASSMFAPGVSQVMAEFDNSNPQLATFVVSVYVLGFAFGPLFIAPASEMYGRTICNICNALFVVFSICCGVSSSYGMLVAFRFLMGCAAVHISYSSVLIVNEVHIDRILVT